MDILIFVFGLVLGAILCFFWPTKKQSQEQIKKERDQLLTENQNYKQEEKKWIEQSSSLKVKNEQFDKELDKQKQHYEERMKERESFFTKEIENVKHLHQERIHEQKQNYEKTIQDRDEHLKQVKVEFEHIARKILQSTISQSTKESEKSLNHLLNPLKEKIVAFEKTVQESSGERKQQILSLKEEIKTITETNQSLTQALKGNTKVQGDWGEATLKRILENSGLREGENFTIQKGLKNEEGQNLRPDVVVHLPDKRDIIIDSKVSLTHYHNYTLSKTEEERKQYVKQIVSSLSQHIDDLSKKSYNKAKDLNTLDFVLMFVPLEGALSLAFQSVLQTQKNLFEEALKKDVMIVSPVTLHATLKIIYTLWQIERQSKNVEKIAKQGDICMIDLLVF